MFYIDLFQLILGLVTLAAAAAGALSIVRRHRSDASFYVTAAGLLAFAFFVSLPRWEHGIVVALLLTFAGVVIAPAGADSELFESTATRRRG